MVEVKKRGEQVIRRDVLVQKHGLNERQSKAMEYLLQHGKLTIKDFEVLCPEVNRHSLQRELNGFLGKGLISEVGAGPLTQRAIMCCQSYDKLWHGAVTLLWQMQWQERI